MSNAEERKRRLRFVGELNNLCMRYGLHLTFDTISAAKVLDGGREYELSDGGRFLFLTGAAAENPAHTSHHTPGEPSPKG